MGARRRWQMAAAGWQRTNNGAVTRCRCEDRYGVFQRNRRPSSRTVQRRWTSPNYTTVKFAYAITSHLAPTSSNCTCTRACAPAPS